MRIVNNSAAFNTWTNYTANLNNMQSSMKKLSTGVIASADDPAGIGIAERSRSQQDTVTTKAVPDAESSTTKIEEAISYVTKARAGLNNGQQANFGTTRNSLLQFEENLQSAETRVRDVDMANQSKMFAQYQSLSSSSNAMLAQANQLPGSILNLLG